MSTGEKAEEAARTLGKYIVHTHAKDGILIKHADLEIVRRPPRSISGNPTTAARFCSERATSTGRNTLPCLTKSATQAT
ncbi:MAG: hypothetical protein ACLR5G_01955 [Eubacteriales bacterium]